MRKAISFIVCLILCFGCTFSSFAAEPTMEEIAFTGETISMNLDDVISLMMTTGTAIESARINKKSDEAIASGYSESYNTVQNTLDYLNTISLASESALGLSGSVAGIDEKIAKQTRDFARANLETNYQAQLNSIEKGAVELFYQTLQAQEYFKVAKEDLAAKQATLNNVQKKYNLGAASKLDLMTAQNALISSKSDLSEATVSYYSSKMNFNLQMGYPLMQQIALNAKPEVLTNSAIDLNAAIASAQEKRNEVKVVGFAFELQETIFNNVKLITSRSSSAYKKQEVAYLQAKQKALQIGDQMAMDVRIKYMELVQKSQAVVSSQSTATLTAEAYRIAKLTYNAGMSTLAELQASEVTYNKAKLGQIAANTDYAVAAYEFGYAQGVGTSRLAL